MSFLNVHHDALDGRPLDLAVGSGAGACRPCFTLRLATQDRGDPITRAINVHASEAEVTASCRSQGAIISAIETLVSGGTRVVLSNMEGTTKMRRVFGSKVIAGDVRRAPLRDRARY